MKEETLKKSLLMIGIVAVLILLLTIYICINIFSSEKASLSIYPDVEPGSTFEGLGIKEDEFKDYLSVFSLLVNEDYSEKNEEILNDIRFLDTAVSFLKNLSSYEEVLNNEGLDVYSSEDIHILAKEIRGMYVNNALKTGERYIYNDSEKTYTKNGTENKIARCTDIDEIEKNSDVISVKYRCVFAEDEDSNSDKKNVYNVEITILENSNYQYSKYFVHSIKVY